MSYTRREFMKTGALALGAAAAGERVVSGLKKGGSEAHAAGPEPVYEIYALKYAGPFTSSLAMLLWNEGWNEQIDRNYYIWVIKGKDENIIVDTGTGVTLAGQRKLKGYVNPVHFFFWNCWLA